MISSKTPELPPVAVVTKIQAVKPNMPFASEYKRSNEVALKGK
jgi:hypothetical protein